MNKIRLYHRLAAAIFLLAFFFQSFQKELVFADYLFDTASYIAQCINKQKPETQCNGKCQMIKKMKDVDENQKSTPDRQVKSADIVLFFEYPSQHLKSLLSFEKRMYPVALVLETKDIAYSLFKPPTT